MTTLRYLARGVVVEAGSGCPIPGLIVRAYDKDMFFDDFLGATTTSERGSFFIRFSEDAFRDFSELSPDLYLRIYDPKTDRMIHQTRVHRDFASDESFRIEVKYAAGG